jgi:hypothetical protein
MNTSRKVECNHHNTNTPPNSSNSEKQSCEKTQRKKRFSLSQQQQNSSITACVNDNPVSTNKRIVETDNDPLISSTHVTIPIYSQLHKNQRFTFKKLRNLVLHALELQIGSPIKLKAQASLRKGKFYKLSQ